MRYPEYAVPFSNTAQWNGVRARLLSTPGVSGIDVSQLYDGGAVISLSHTVGFSDLQVALNTSGLQIVQISGAWVLQPY